jgi:hypothetical protein
MEDGKAEYGNADHPADDCHDDDHGSVINCLIGLVYQIDRQVYYKDGKICY